MAGVALHLLVTFLALSSLVFLNAAATSRTMDQLFEGQEIQSLDDINQIPTEEIAREEIMSRRMDFQINDYPGPGANNRHMPKAPPGAD